mgnify:CR=1 FL=1
MLESYIYKYIYICIGTTTRKNNNDNHSKHPKGDHPPQKNNNGTPKGVTHPYVYFDNEEGVQRQPTSKWYMIKGKW